MLTSVLETSGIDAMAAGVCGELVLELQSVSVEVEVVGAQPREMEDPSTLLESQGLGPCAFGPCQPCRQQELRGLLR